MNSLCSYYNKKICQTCQFIELDYLEQVKHKEDQLKKSLSDFTEILPLHSITSPSQGFRNKAKVSVTGTLSNPILGLAGEKNFDQGREILNCPLHHPRINEVLANLSPFITLAGLTPYQINSRQGELKGVIIYYSEESHEAYLRFILRSKEAIDRIKKYLPGLQEKFAFIKCISANIQPIPHAILEGDEEIILTTETSIKHQLDKIHFNLGPKGFVQTNQKVATKLYQTAASWVDELKIKKFAELFCGQGAFSFFIAPHLDQAIGFEINPSAIEEANKSVKEQNLKNIIFKCADAATVGSDLEFFNPNLVLVNPPRRGLAESVHLLTQKKWPYLVYSSCNVETLKKDLEQLNELYEIKKFQLFDMFPHSEHFETLVLLKARS
jgi:23S rRNA (uracil747-C5)-methyltransferase